MLEHRELRARQGELEAIVAGQALSAFRDAEAIRLDALHRLALAAEYRDDNSPEHTQRVAALAARMARHLGEGDRAVRLVRQAAPLHDLGKIAIPDSILLKPGRLEPEEYEVVKTHAVLGARVLEGGDSELLAVAERIARSHHERWDGGGYPDGLAGEAIPLVGAARRGRRRLRRARARAALQGGLERRGRGRRDPRGARARSSIPRWSRRSTRSAPAAGRPH